MFAIIIQEKGGEARRVVFNKPEVTVGRVQGNDIVLPKGNVSKKHARIVLKDGKYIIVDLKSTNGTYVNGRKITSPLVVKEVDKIYIGDFIISVDEGGAGAGVGDQGPGLENAPPMPAPQPVMVAPQPVMPAPMPAPAPPPPRPMQPSSAPPLAAAPPQHAPSQVDVEPPRAVPMRAPATPTRDPMASSQPVAREPAALGPPPAREPIAGVPPPSAPRPRGPTASIPAAMPPAAPAPLPIAAPAPLPPPVLEPMPAPAAAPVAVAASPSGSNGGPARPRPSAAAVTSAPPRREPPRAVPSSSHRGANIEPLDARVVKALDLQHQVLERLIGEFAAESISRMSFESLRDRDLWQRAEQQIGDLVANLESSGELSGGIDRVALIKDTVNEALGFGALEDLLTDGSIDEIFVDRRDRIAVGKDGTLRGAGRGFSSDAALLRIVDRLVAQGGRRVGDSAVIDARLADGARLTAVLSPVASSAACLAIRKRRQSQPALPDLIGAGSLSPAMAEFLRACISARRNILVCGAASAGRTTVISALANAAPAGERVVSVENVGELIPGRSEWISLEANGISGAQLIRAALQLQPDRLVVGDLCGKEAYDVVVALNASTDGAIVGVAGDSAASALRRISTMARLNDGVGDAAKDLVASAFEVVLHVSRNSDGTVRVTHIDEVLGLGDGSFETQPIFAWQGNAFAGFGVAPRFYGELAARGIAADQSIFASR